MLGNGFQPQANTESICRGPRGSHLPSFSLSRLESSDSNVYSPTGPHRVIQHRIFSPKPNFKVTPHPTPQTPIHKLQTLNPAVRRCAHRRSRIANLHRSANMRTSEPRTKKNPATRPRNPEPENPSPKPRPRKPLVGRESGAGA